LALPGVVSTLNSTWAGLQLLETRQVLEYRYRMRATRQETPRHQMQHGMPLTEWRRGVATGALSTLTSTWAGQRLLETRQFWEKRHRMRVTWQETLREPMRLVQRIHDFHMQTEISQMEHQPLLLWNLQSSYLRTATQLEFRFAKQHCKWWRSMHL
jgi:hypothetical protein